MKLSQQTNSKLFKAFTLFPKQFKDFFSFLKFKDYSRPEFKAGTETCGMILSGSKKVG